jgi:hypothetical protein
VLFDFPETLAEFDQEWVGVLVLEGAGPVAAVLVRKHDLSEQDLLVRVRSFTVVLNAVQLFNVQFHYVRPCLAVVQVDTVDLVSNINYHYFFINSIVS